MRTSRGGRNGKWNIFGRPDQHLRLTLVAAHGLPPLTPHLGSSKSVEELKTQLTRVLGCRLGMKEALLS